MDPKNLYACLLLLTLSAQAQISQPQDHFILTLQPTPSQQSALDTLTAQLQDPASPSYHKFLTPAQFAAAFGAPQSDLDKLTAWLTTSGFQIQEIVPNHRAIVFSGTAAQVQSAFQTSQLPVQGTVTLSNFNTHPHSAAAPAAAHSLLPADLAAIYNLNPLYNSGLNGTSQSIAIIGRSGINPADIAAFRAARGLPDNPVTTILAAGTDPGIANDDDALEATLDTEWAGAIAPRANIKLVIAASTASTDGIDLAAQYAISHNVAPIVSISFGACEAAANNAFYSALWQQAAAQGISVIVSAGDSGPAGCDLPTAPSATLPSVNALCSTPHNTCVGGTQFADTQNPGAFWHPGANALLGSQLASATGYIPEQAWNESALNGGTGLLSGAGGLSTIYPNPNWQTGAAAYRRIPDISLAAARHNGYLIWFNGAPLTVSGTSAAAPAFAGILALINQKTASPQGNISPALYSLAAQPGIFHDITSGNTSVPGLPGHAAAAGYDLATGLGSVNAAQLAEHFTASVTPSCTLSASTASPNVGPTRSTAVTLTCGSVQGTFSGSLALSVSGAPAGITTSFSPAATLAPGTGATTLNISASSAAALGTDNLVVTATAASFSTTLTLSLSVTTPATFNITPSATTFTIPQGTTQTLTLTSVHSGSFNSAIAFQTSGLPSSVVTTLSAAAIAAPGDGTVTITLAPLSSANPAPVGTYTMLVLATGGSLQLRIPITVTVTAAPAFTFTASAAVLTLRNPYVPSGTAPVPTTATLTLTTSLLTNGFSLPVTLTAGTLPAGVTAAFSPAIIAAPGSGTSTLTLTIASAATTGVSTFTISATGGNVTRYANVKLTITTPATFTIVPTYSSYTLMAGNSLTQTLTATPVFGFNSNINLTASAPPGINASLSAATISGNYGTAQLTIQPFITTAAGTYTVTLTATDPVTTNAQTLSITLTVASVTTTLANSAITLARGTPVITTITTAATSYTGNVVLSLTGLPAGVSPTFSPASIVGGSGTSTMTLLATVNTAPGTYLVTLKSSAAGVIFTTTFTLTIT